MPEYIMLFHYTTEGVRTIKEAPNRINNVRKLFTQNGAQVKSFYAVLGQYDTVCIVEAPDDETIAKISLQISALGNVQGETLRAFTEEQMVNIVSQIP